MRDLNASVHSLHWIINDFLRPVAYSEFRPSLFGVRSISLADVGTRYADPRKISNNSSSVDDTALVDASLEYAGDTLFSGDPDQPLRTPVLTEDLSGGAPHAQVKCSSAKSESNTVESVNEYFEVPFTPRAFVGREELLRELVDYFSSTSEGQKRVMISGVAGIGKSQLAARVAFELRKLFYGVSWINASSHELIRAGLADVARILHLVPHHSAGYRFLASLRKPWLLIMDNADESNLLVEDYLPSNQLGSILSITRRPVSSVSCTPGSSWRSYALEGLSKREEAELVLSAAGRKQPYNTADVMTASHIAAAVGDLPLALYQAGVTVASGICDLESYVKMFSAKMQSFKNDQQGRLSPIDTRMDQLFQLSLQALNEDALQILKLVSCFNADNIPTDVFLGTIRRHHSSSEGHAEMWDDEWNNAPRLITSPIIPHQLRLIVNKLLRIPRLQRMFRTPAILPSILKPTSLSQSSTELRVQDALENLRRYGLIDWDNCRATFSVYRLLQEYTRKFLSLGDEAVICEYAMAILADCINFEQDSFSRAVVSVDVRCLILHIIDVRRRHLEVL